jgi:hypothetical protein
MTFAGSWNAALAGKVGLHGAFSRPSVRKTQQWVVNSPESAIGASNTHRPGIRRRQEEFLEFWFSPKAIN